MKTKTIVLLALCLLLAAPLLTACQAISGAPAAASAQQQPTATAEEVKPTATRRATATAKPQPTATPAADALAEQAARDYFASLEKGDFEQAAEQVSTYSLMVFNLTKGDAASLLQTQKISGARWSDLKISETKPFDEQTMLVHVTYSLQSKAKADVKPTAGAKPTASATATADAKATPEAAKGDTVVKDELWPMRLENNTWRYNWNNLIDYRTLTLDPQTTTGVTMMPVQLLRYSDRICLVSLVQNRTNAVVVFGQVNEILATFHFGDETVEAEKTRYILNPLRSVPDVTFEIKGLFTSFPDSVEIRKWTTYNVKPWYVFQLK